MKENNKKALLDLETDQIGEVVKLEGGGRFKRRLGTRGIQLGKTLKVVTKQPGGPLVVKCSGSQLTVGRGMARKIIVEVEFE